MNGSTLRGTTAALGCCLFCLLIPGCQEPPAQGEGKIPVTTSSEQARELFLQGRDLAEKLRLTDSRRYFQDALEQDPSFALAHLALAQSSPTTAGFYDSLDAALGALDGVSDGERHMILAVEAGAKRDLAAQQAHLEALVEAYPEDERGHDLLGNFHFNRQDWDRAITAYRRATEIDPDFSPPYNSLGYALRGLRRYEEAEAAFRRYIELIPDEPNPYDSYADLLMKMGRFEESIENYEQALSFNPNFIASHVGAGHDYLFLDRPEQARESFRKLMGIARNDAERRQALLWMAASYLYEGDRDRALEQVRAMSAIAEEAGDKAVISGDLVLTGNILLRTGSPEEALDRFRVAVEVMETAAVPEEVKGNTRRHHLYNEARVALALGDVATARSKAGEYNEQVAARGIPEERRRWHELAGMISLRNGEFDAAMGHLIEADQQDPIVLFLQAEVWAGMGDVQKAREVMKRVANFNAINFNYAFVRAEARRKLEDWN
jgi:tetratricopeptide (TPR) repeat protein